MFKKFGKCNSKPTKNLAIKIRLNLVI